MEVDEISDERLTRALCCVEGSLLIAVLVSMTLGSGFHVRQGWRVHNKTSDELIQCGLNVLQQAKLTESNASRRLLRHAGMLNPADRNTSTSTMSAADFKRQSKVDASVSESCRSKLSALPVDTMHGYDGSCGILSGLWGPLYMTPQYYVFALCSANVVTTVSLLLLKSIQCRIVILIIGGISLQIVALSNGYCAWCHDYEQIELDQFNTLVESMPGVNYDQYDIAVHCFIQGFVIAAAFAEIACLTYTLHAILLSRIQRSQMLTGQSLETTARQHGWNVEAVTEDVDAALTTTKSAGTSPSQRSSPSQRKSSPGDSSRKSSRARRLWEKLTFSSPQPSLIKPPKQKIMTVDPVLQLQQKPEKPILITNQPREHNRRVVITNEEAQEIGVPGKEDNCSRIGKWHMQGHGWDYEEPISPSSLSTLVTSPPIKSKFEDLPSSLRLPALKKKKKATPSSP